MTRLEVITATPRLEHEARMLTLRVYSRSRHNPTASAQVFCYGDRGMLFSIMGKEFWQAADLVSERCRSFYLETLEGYITPAHARLATTILSPLGYLHTFAAPKQVKAYGNRLMCWSVWNLRKTEIYGEG